MREIKFRAYDTFTNKMWQWEQHNAFTTERGSIKQWFTDHDLKIMQYTGFKDKHGVEVYEGDILKFGSIKAPIEWGNILVEMMRTGVYQGLTCYYITLKNKRMIPLTDSGPDGVCHMTIIGNIYESPELIDK